MAEAVQVDIVTIFPPMITGFLGESMLKRAEDHGLVKFRIVDPRDFTSDTHRTVDDRPYGGGPGMVMKPEPICAAVESVMTPGARVILTTPQGKRFEQSVATDLAKVGHMVFVCGHYEGVDERIIQEVVTDEVSIGDYVLTNGTLAAAVIIDAVIRLVPGVVGAEGATSEDSFSNGLLEYPQYTRPRSFRGRDVPDILFGGNHEEIRQWRDRLARERTRERRPDLLK